MVSGSSVPKVTAAVAVPGGWGFGCSCNCGDWCAAEVLCAETVKGVLAHPLTTATVVVVDAQVLRLRACCALVLTTRL